MRVAQDFFATYRRYAMVLLGIASLLQPVSVVFGIQQDTVRAIARQQQVHFNGEDDPLSSLQGMRDGVIVSNYSGHPGDSVTIRIRGVNSLFFNQDPLILLDGIPILSAVDMNMLDIENIEVIRDVASSSLYGSQGANGVVLITSKRGTEGRNMIEFSTSYGVTSQPVRMQLLDGTENFNYIVDLNQPLIGGEDDKSAFWGTGDFVSNGFINTANLQNIDWQDRLFQAGAVQNYHLSFNGGSEVTNFRISGFYSKNDGVVRPSDFSKMGISLNLDRKIKERITISSGIRFTSSGKSLVNTSSSAEDGGVILSALASPSFLPVLDENGDYFINPLRPGINNVDANINGVFNTSARNVIMGNIKADVELGSHLNLELSGSSNLSLSREDLFYSTRHVYLGRENSGMAKFHASEFVVWDAKALLSYNRQSEKHDLLLKGGVIRQGASHGWNSAVGTGFSNDDIRLLGTAADKKASSNLHGYDGLAYLANLTYEFNQRYYVEATIRADGNSRFSESIEIISDPIKPDVWEFVKDRKWGTSEGIALGWNLSNESFMANMEHISDLSLELAYGIAGNDGGLNTGRYYPYLWSPTGYSMNPDEDFTEAIFPVIGYNVYNLQENFWEKSSELNISADLSLLNSRINMGASYYMKTATDLLLPESDTTYANLGSMQTNGLDLHIQTVNISNSWIQWHTSLNFSKMSNEILSTNQANDIYEVGFTGISNVIKQGDPAFALWGLETDGLFQNQQEVDAHAAQPGAGPGDIRYVNQNGDDVIDENDRVVIGNPNPDMIIGFGNSIYLGNFEITALFTGVFGQDKMNLTRMQTEGLNDWINQSEIALDRFTGSGSSNEVHRASTGINNTLISDRFVEDASFIRLKQLTLSYGIPSKILEKAGIESIRIHVSGRNLWTRTGYSGYDPEVSMMGPLNIDFGTYPNSKYLGGGVSVRF